MAIVIAFIKSSDVFQLILGIVVGIGLVGSSIQRTISVSRGEYLGTFLSNNFGSIFYFLSTSFIVKGNMIAFVGTAIGSIIVSTFLCYMNRKKLKGLEKYEK